MDPHGEHDQRCGFAVSLRRHDIVQSVLEKKMKCAGKAIRLATVHELRFGVADPSQQIVHVVSIQCGKCIAAVLAQGETFLRGQATAAYDPRCKLQCRPTFIEKVITYRWVLRFYA